MDSLSNLHTVSDGADSEPRLTGSKVLAFNHCTQQPVRVKRSKVTSVPQLEHGALTESCQWVATEKI